MTHTKRRMTKITDDEDDKHNNKEKEMEMEMKMKMKMMNASHRIWMKEKIESDGEFRWNSK